MQRSAKLYTQTKKKRQIFMVLYLSIQLGCCNKNKTKMVIKRPTHKNGNYLILSSDLEELSNLMYTHLFPLSSGIHHQNVTHFTLNGNQKLPTVKKHLKIPCLLIERAKLQFQIFHLRNKLKLLPFQLNK